MSYATSAFIRCHGAIDQKLHVPDTAYHAMEVALSAVGQRAFCSSVAGPSVGNSLRDELRYPGCIYRQNLQTVAENILSSAGWPIRISLSKCCLHACLGVNPGWRKSQPLHTETCNIAYTELIINPDRTPKTRSVWSTLRSKSPGYKSGREGV